MGEPGESSSAQEVELVIKNPAHTSGDFRLSATLSSTVQQVKELLQAHYEGRPAPELQTLIYCGKVLKDGKVVLKDTVKQNVDSSPIYTFHSVVKQPPATPPMPRSPPAPQEQSPGPATATTQEPPPVLPASAAPPAPPTAPAADSHPDPTAPASTTPPSASLPPPSETSDRSVADSAPPQPQQSGTPSDSNSQTTGESAPSSGLPGGAYYLMDPVMAAAYKAALSALMGASPEAALEMQHAAVPMPYPIAHPMATFVAPMAQHAQNGPQGTAAQQAYGAVQYPYGGGIPYHFQPYPSMAYPYAYPQMFPQGGGADPQGRGSHASGPSHPTNPQPGQQGSAQPAPQQHGEQGGGGAAPARRQMRVRLIRVNLKMLLQLGVFALVLYQHCSPTRFFLLVVGGLLLYLAAMLPISRVLQNLVVGANPRPGGGFFREVKVLVLGFAASLLPGWNYNPEDAAAFAAAQDIAAAEAAGPGNERREHQD